MKCTHDSEGLVICKDKCKLNIQAAKDKLSSALKHNFYYIGREWPYKNIQPRIIAETYMEDRTDSELRDYKFFCFDGEPRVMYIASGRGRDATRFDYFDMEFNHLDIMQKYPNAREPLRKPETFEQMIETAKILAKDLAHVRVDFYEVDGRPYVGELTFYHLSGFIPFRPSKWDKIFGEWLTLPE